MASSGSAEWVEEPGVFKTDVPQEWVPGSGWCDDGNADVGAKMTASEAEDALSEMLVFNFNSGKERWTAEDICIIAFYVSLIGHVAGGAGSVEESSRGSFEVPLRPQGEECITSDRRRANEVKGARMQSERPIHQDHATGASVEPSRRAP